MEVSNLGKDTNEDLAEGRIDLAMGLVAQFAPPRASQGVRSQQLLSDAFVCVVRDGHPLVKKRLSLADFIALPHALVSPGGASGGVVDTALAQIGKKRRVAVQIPHFLVAPHVVRETDVVLTLAERIARILAPMLGLRQIAPPLELGGFSTAMGWHERQHADPAHAWLRGVIAKVVKEL